MTPERPPSRSRDARRVLGITRTQYARTVRRTHASPARMIVDRLDMGGLDGRHWGSLAGRENRGVRDVLRALCHADPAPSTVRELAELIPLSAQYTRRCLRTLEALGIVQWHRAAIDHTGSPQPGWIAVSVEHLVNAVVLAEAHPWARG